jgi:hypothetical protein
MPSSTPSVPLRVAAKIRAIRAMRAVSFTIVF